MQIADRGTQGSYLGVLFLKFSDENRVAPTIRLIHIRQRLLWHRYPFWRTSYNGGSHCPLENAAYRIVSYRIISYHIISYHIISYHIISSLFVENNTKAVIENCGQSQAIALTTVLKQTQKY